MRPPACCSPVPLWTYSAVAENGLAQSPAREPYFPAVVAASVVGAAVALGIFAALMWQFGGPLYAGTPPAIVEVCLAPAVVAAAHASPLALAGLWSALIILQRSVAKAFDREHAALHDHLTGLPNRAQLEQRFSRRRNVRKEPARAVLLLDLDRFKQVNDTLGHQAGDQLLQEVANRLRSLLKDGDLPVRLGGDEFAVLSSASDSADILAQRLIDDLAAPYDLDAGSASVGVSIGIAREQGQGTDVAKLLEQADEALYRAKATRGCWAA